MKKIVALLLAAVLGLMALSALAEEPAEPVLEIKNVGITLHYPEAFANMEGVLATMMAEEYEDENHKGTGDYFLQVDYFAMPVEEYVEIINAEEPTEEQVERYNEADKPFLVMLGIKDGNDVTKIVPDTSILMEAAKAEGHTWYTVSVMEETEISDPKYAAEFETLKAQIPELLSKAEFYDAVSPFSAYEGKHIEFTTQDLEGNPVDSAELFSQHEYTAVNIWATWCGYCVDEMPELNELNDRLADIDCGIVGILWDSSKSGKLEIGKEIVEETGVQYPVLQIPENGKDLLLVQAYPTTYFVDRNGNIVGKPFTGVALKPTEDRLHELTGK